MFMLYAIPLGIMAGLLLGGRLAGLSSLSFRWGWLSVGALLVQAVLFVDPVAAAVGDLGVPIYLASNALVLIAIIANIRLVGLPLVALGAALNLVVIIANGGYMPASGDEYAAQGIAPVEGYSNTRVIAEPVLAPFTDRIALPPWLPFTNVISVGDLLIAAGTATAIAGTMRSRPVPGRTSDGLPAVG